MRYLSNAELQIPSLSLRVRILEARHAKELASLTPREREQAIRLLSEIGTLDYCFDEIPRSNESARKIVMDRINTLSLAFGAAITQLQLRKRPLTHRHGKVISMSSYRKR
jgi:hypothetical protein